MSLKDGVRTCFQHAMYWTVVVYWKARLTYPMLHTDRYIDFRPGDVFLFDGFVILFVFGGIPLVILLWAVGVIPAGYAALAAVVLFLLPPAITFGFMEIVLLCQRSKRP